jgi:hypothetical protein
VGQPETEPANEITECRGAVVVMSHSEGLSRLTVGGSWSDMFGSVLQKGIGKFERESNTETHPFWIRGENL